MFSFFKPKCRSYTNIFDSFVSNDLDLSIINKSLESTTLYHTQIIQLKNITNIKYVQDTTKKTLIKIPKHIIIYLKVLFL